MVASPHRVIRASRIRLSPAFLVGTLRGTGGFPC